MKYLLLTLLIVLVSCVQKEEKISNQSLGRFSDNSISLLFSDVNNIIQMGSEVNISPTLTKGKIVTCGIKYGTTGLPPGMTVDNKCNIKGTALSLALTSTYKVIATSEYNTTAEAEVKITVGTFYNLGGTVSGLGDGDVVTISNGIAMTPVSGNGSFLLTSVANGSSYTVTVAPNKPDRLSCIISNGSGTISQNTLDLTVNCTPNRTLAGTLAGLISTDGDVVIKNNEVTKTLLNNGSFSFGSISYGSAYDISIDSYPPGYSCSRSANASGSLNNDVSTVAITCVPPIPKNISVSVTGLNTGSFTIKNSGTKNDGASINEDLTINQNGQFTFLNQVKYNTPYSVSIVSPQNQHNCTISNNSGTVLADVTNISINCIANTSTVGGSVEGLIANEHVKFVFNDETSANEYDHIQTSAVSPFTVPRHFQYGRQYRMYITEVPSGKKCSFTTSNPSPPYEISGDRVQGYITDTGNVTDLKISCSARDVTNCEFGHQNYMIPNDIVKDMACDGNHLYVAGTFGGVGYQNGSLSEINPTDLSVDYKQSFHVEGGAVRSAVEDGNGGLYIGGSFTKVNGVAQVGIAHLYQDGSLDKTFNQSINEGLGVYKIILKDNFLYVAGSFKSPGYGSGGKLVKINKYNGSLITKSSDGINNDYYDLNTSGYIYDMKLVGSKLYVAGNFTQVIPKKQNSSGGSITSLTPSFRACFAEIDTTTDTLTNASLNFSGSCSIYTLEVDAASNLYIGGKFSEAGSVSKMDNLLRLTSTGSLDSTFLLSPNNTVTKIKKITENGDEKILIGGIFDKLANITSPALVKYNLTSEAKESMAYALTSVLKIIDSPSNFFVFDINGNISKYDKSSSAGPVLNTPNLSKQANEYVSSYGEFINNKILISNNYISGNNVTADRIKHLYRYNPNTGRIDNSFNLDLNSTVNSLYLENGFLYIGGNFTSVLGSSNIRYASKINLSPAPSVDATFDLTLDSYVSKLYKYNDELIITGAFTTINGFSGKKYIASINHIGGEFIASVDAANIPSLPSGTYFSGADFYVTNSAYTNISKYTIGVSAITQDTSFSTPGNSNLNYIGFSGTSLYVCGSSLITYNNSATSKYLIKLDTSGARDTSFTKTTAPCNAPPYFSQDGSSFYLGSNSNYTKYSTDSTSALTQVIHTSSSAANKVIEGNNFLLLGGSINTSSASVGRPQYILQSIK